MTDAEGVDDELHRVARARPVVELFAQCAREHVLADAPTRAGPVQHDDYFAQEYLVAQLISELAHGPATDLFVNLGELSRDRHLSLGV